MLRDDMGVLCAPTAFGKTVTGAALIARRGVNTLVLLHRAELLKQWQERLQTFLQRPGFFWTRFWGQIVSGEWGLEMLNEKDAGGVAPGSLEGARSTFRRVSLAT